MLKETQFSYVPSIDKCSHISHLTSVVALISFLSLIFLSSLAMLATLTVWQCPVQVEQMKLIISYLFFFLCLWSLYLLSKQTFKSFEEQQPQECWYQLSSITHGYNYFLTAFLCMVWESTAWMRQIEKCYNTPLQQNHIKGRVCWDSCTWKDVLEWFKNGLTLWIQHNSKINWS